MAGASLLGLSACRHLRKACVDATCSGSAGSGLICYDIRPHFLQSEKAPTIIIALVLLWEHRELLLVGGGMRTFCAVFKGNAQERQAS